MARLNSKEMIWSLNYRSLLVQEIENITLKERIKNKRLNWIVLLKRLFSVLFKTSIATKSE
jgi:hypothetical protein